MAKFASQANEIISQAAGNRQDWTKWDEALLHLCVAADDTIEGLEGTIDKADKHTAFLMESIKGLETKLKAAEYAAKVNYDGWQQEIARKSR